MNGIIVLNKPAGRTSFEAVREVCRLFSKEKAGHSGTLDPMATGVLPIFIGRATKLIQYLPDTDKEYVADIAFGIQTDTGDKEGKPIKAGQNRPNENDWKTSVASHLGIQKQVPPMYSAIKKDGVPLYYLARKGKTIEREPRTIEIKEIETLGFSRDSARIRIRCSAGTYIRTLAEDIAAQCGCYAYLTALVRNFACGFSVKETVTLEQLEKSESREQFVIPPEKVFVEYPSVELDDNLSRLFLNGFVFPVSRTNKPYCGECRINVYNDGKYLGLGEVTETFELKKLWQAELL
ncbi:MAG: tRNA pseudouridine(55) synthase TruB [Oscillospiraceae bacterium]|nr:tRNA pseudouridine(55) synthase TruB [Oscillospiraceae bacterium]